LKKLALRNCGELMSSTIENTEKNHLVLR